MRYEMLAFRQLIQIAHLLLAIANEALLRHLSPKVRLSPN
jgi:hypothetical protein